MLGAQTVILLEENIRKKPCDTGFGNSNFMAVKSKIIKRKVQICQN